MNSLLRGTRGPVRLAVVGLGDKGRACADYLLAGAVRGARLAAVCNRSAAPLAAYRARGVAAFASAAELFGSGAADAAIVLTPHPTHVDLALAAVEHGLHVLVEKPLAAHKADAERLVRGCAGRPLVAAALHNLRADPLHAHVRALLRRGVLGTVQRIDWVVTDWFRTDAYYKARPWRGTWAGEGGGVLLNQALHQLDLLCWYCGRPERVRAFCRLGRHHPIETEDEVTAYLEYAGGASAVFVTGTGESPGVNRLEIAGDAGTLTVEGRVVRLALNRRSTRAVLRSCNEPMPAPDCRVTARTFRPAAGLHAAAVQNFVNAIRNGAALLAPLAEGVAAVELANAMSYSSARGRTVELPLDARAYARWLAARCRSGAVKKEGHWRPRRVKEGQWRLTPRH